MHTAVKPHTVHRVLTAAPDLKRLLCSGGFDYSSVGARDIISLKILCCIPRSPIVRKIYLLREPGSMFPVSCLPPY